MTIEDSMTFSTRSRAKGAAASLVSVLLELFLQADNRLGLVPRLDSVVLSFVMGSMAHGGPEI